MTLAKFVVLLAAAFFLFYGLAFTAAPGAMSLMVTGAEPEGVSALVDFRATYGGMTVAVGVAMFYLYSIGQVRVCLIVVAMVLLGMAAGRSLGMLVDGPGNFLMTLYLVLEIGGAALALYAMRGLENDANGQ